MNNNFQQPNNGAYIDPQDIENNKVMSLFSYLGILFLVPLLACKDSQYARFHANQGIVLFISEIVLTVAMFIFALIPVVGFILCIVVYLAYIVLFVFMIMGIVNAVTGKVKALPLIGGITILK